MYSSPGIPTGRSRRSGSRTKNLVLAMGRPIGWLPASPGVTRCAADQTVVSVGQYRFHIETERDVSSRANSAGNASPPQRTFKFPPVQPALMSRRQVVGVA